MSGQAQGNWTSSGRPLPPEPTMHPPRRNQSKKGIVEVFNERRMRGLFGRASPPPPLPSALPQPQQRGPPPPGPRPPLNSRPRTTPLALPPSHATRDPLAAFLPSDLNVVNSGPVALNRSWPGFKVEKLALGFLDQRKFQSFTVERDCGIKEGLLRVGRDEGRDVGISGYAFNGVPPIKIKFTPGSIIRIYLAPAEPKQQIGADGERERIQLIIEAKWTAQFAGYFSTNDFGNPNGTIRLNALDKKHLDELSLLSRHFLLTLSLPPDCSLAGQSPTPYSLNDLSHLLSSADHLPKPAQLPRLDILFNARQYRRKTLVRLASAFSSVPPPIAYQLESLLRSGTLTPTEIITLLDDHVRPWMDTATVPYGEGLAEDILERLNRILTEDRDTRAAMLELGYSPEEFAKERDWEWTLADKAGAAHDAVVEGLAREDRERKEKIAAGLKVKKKKEEASSNEHFWCRTIGFTPSRTVLVMGRTLEMSNALIRKYYHGVDYHSEADYFLRVIFVDEDGLPLPGGTGAAYDRLIDGSMRAMMLKGLQFGGRTYKFLAYSQSGQRERTVWFVASWPVETKGEIRQVSAADIRKDMGEFGKVSRQPAKLGARWSQAFTSSRASVFLRDDQLLEMDDILVLDKDGKECSNHTDGAGLMSEELRDQAWQVLLNNGFRRDKDGPPPTVFQFRLGGYKGVLAVDPTLKGVCLALRPSQRKFLAYQDDPASSSFCLNIADVFTRPNSLFLNRPLISALDDGGVDTLVLLALQRRAVDLIAPSELQTLFGALAALKKFSFGGPTRFRSLISSLFELRQIPDKLLVEEPFLRETLQVVRVRSLRDIRHRARIPVDGACSLVGVPDEDSFLKPDQIYIKLIFFDKPDEPVFLEGPIAITRSPVVDPGDVRIVHAIGKLPEGSSLRMAVLSNCVVLPTTGKRSLASMMGGGDVDGDKFDIIPLPDLIPKRTVPPRSHEGDLPLELDRDATIEDVAACFINYARNDCLGVIAHRHLIYADLNPLHGFSAECQQLADLYSRAVDTPKTGVVVHREELPRAPKRRPDFLKFSDGDTTAENGDADYYESKRALGFLFRDIDAKELKTPPTLAGELTINPTAIDSTSSSFEHLRLVVEHRLCDLFDCNPAHLKGLVDKYRPLLPSKLISFASSISQYAVQFSQPRTSGRKLSEYEIFAVTSLLEGERKIDRGTSMASLARQIGALVKWLEQDLTSGGKEAAFSTRLGEVETLAKRYAAWVIAREMDEWEFGVKTARWTTLALLLEAMEAAEKEKKEREGSSSPKTRFSGEAVPLPTPSVGGPPPPPPPRPMASFPPGGLPTPPASPPQYRSDPSTAPSAPRPRTPHETRPTTSLPSPPLPSQHVVSPPVLPNVPRHPPSSRVPRPSAPQATTSSHKNPLLSPSVDHDPWQISARQTAAYGDNFSGFNDPAEDYDSDESVEDEEEMFNRALEPLRWNEGPVEASRAGPVGTIAEYEDEEEQEESNVEEIVWQGRMGGEHRRDEEEEEEGKEEEEARRRRVSKEEDEEHRRRLTGERERKAFVQGSAKWAAGGGGGQAEKVERRVGGAVGYDASSHAPFSSFASTSTGAPPPPPPTERRAPYPFTPSHPFSRSDHASPPHPSSPPPPPAPSVQLHHPTPLRSSLLAPAVLDDSHSHTHPSHDHHHQQQQQQYRAETLTYGRWDEALLPSQWERGEEQGQSSRRCGEKDVQDGWLGQGRTGGREHPPTPPSKRSKYQGNEFWKHFDDADERRYNSNKSGLGKLGRHMVTADGTTYRDAYGLGKGGAKTPEWKRVKRERERGREQLEQGGPAAETVGFEEGDGGPGYEIWGGRKTWAPSWTDKDSSPTAPIPPPSPPSPPAQLPPPPSLPSIAPVSPFLPSYGTAPAAAVDEDDPRNRPFSPELPPLPPPRPPIGRVFPSHPLPSTFDADAAPSWPLFDPTPLTLRGDAARSTGQQVGTRGRRGGQFGAPGDGSGRRW